MIFKHFLGEFSFKIIGSDVVKLINKMTEADFKCSNIKTEENIIYGTIYRSNYKELEEICNKYNCEIEIEKKKGLLTKILPYKKRYGIIIGAILSILIILYFSNTILKLRIIGCSPELKKNIQSYLLHEDITTGTFIPLLNFDELEDDLRLRFGVSWASIRKTAGILTINIHQTTEKPDMIQTRFPCNLISTKDAKIIDATVFSGQMIPLIGDGVKKNSLLVSGFVNDVNDKPLYFHSKAKIIGEYKEKILFVQPLKDKEQMISNKNINKYTLNFFGLKIPIGFGKKIKGEYDCKISTNFFSFLGLNLPISITTKKYYPIIYKNKNYTKEEAEKKINEKICIYEENFLKKSKIVNKNVNKEILENSVKISINYLLRGDITKEQQILIKN